MAPPYLSVRDSDTLQANPLLEAIAAPAWLLDPKSDRILEVNSAAIGTYGYSRSEFLSMPMSWLEDRSEPGSGPVLHRTRENGTIEVTLLQREVAGMEARLVIAVDVTEARRELRAVSAQEEYFRSLVEGTTDIIYEADPQGRFTFVNPAVRSILGYSPEELTGRHYSELVREDWRERVVDHYCGQVRDLTRSTYLEFPVLRADGKTVWIAQSVQPVLRNGEMSGVRAVARDVTDRRLSDERFHAFMNNSPTVAFIKQADGRYVFANELMTRLFSLPDGSLIGRSDAELLPPDLASALGANDEQVLSSGKSLHVIEAVPTNEGVVRQWLTYKFPITAADGKQYVGGMAIDLTERLALERELADARDAALGSARMKSQFLANMSHEIRTPMNGVIGLLGVLLDSQLDADQRDLAQTARMSAESLLTIINDILDFSKIEAGKLEFEVLDFDVRTICESSLDLLADTARRKSLELGYVLDPEIPSILRGDPGRLRQVLLNLLSNAVKFTESGGVLLHVECAKRAPDGALLRFQVTDTGMGLSAETRRALFQPFTQSDASTTRRFGGTGLGLAISKQLVQMMNGDIGVESEPGCGSTFWFTSRFECGAAAPASIPSAADGPRVLIVEDSATSRQTMALQLAGWNVNCDIADDGVRALTMLRDGFVAGAPYDIVISDLNMPGIDGVALARLAARNRSEFGSPRFVLVTGSGQSFDAGALAQMGVTTCLRKPVKPAHLYSAVFGRTMAEKPAPPIEKPPAPAPHRAPRRVLVADDNVINQKVALRQLQKLGFAAEAVGNGKEALEALDRIAYDLVLMDCQMPEMDGYAAAREIRHREEARNRHTPVIALTASAAESDRQECLAAGMDDFLSKPVRESDLAAALQRWLPPADKENS